MNFCAEDECCGVHEVTSYQLSPAPPARQQQPRSQEPELPPRRRLPDPSPGFRPRHGPQDSPKAGTMTSNASHGDDWVDVDRSDGEHDVADSGGAVVLTRYYSRNTVPPPPPFTYYWTVPLILDHSYLVGKLKSSKIADTKVLGF